MGITPCVPHGSSTKCNHPILSEEGAHSPSALRGTRGQGAAGPCSGPVAPQELVFEHQLQLRPMQFVQRWKIKLSWAAGAPGRVFSSLIQSQLQAVGVHPLLSCRKELLPVQGSLPLSRNKKLHSEQTWLQWSEM